MRMIYIPKRPYTGAVTVCVINHQVVDDYGNVIHISGESFVQSVMFEFGEIDDTDD